MSNPTSRQLLRRHAIAFAVAFVSLTALLLVNYVRRRLPDLRARGDSTSTIAEFVLLSLPFTAAMTIPMAVLVAVLWVFTRLGADGALAVARRERHGVRHLLAPILGAAAVVGALTFVFNDQIVPRANARLSTLQVGGAHEPGDREMTIGQLRAAARRAGADTAPNAIARAASYEVEIQKKYALSAASVVFALTAAAIVFLLPRGGVVLVIGATLMVFAVYYVGLIAGESLADRLMVSPFVAMWMANALLLTFTLLVLWGTRWSRTPSGAEALPIESAPGETLSLRVAAGLCALVGLLGLGGTVAWSVAFTPSARLGWIALGVSASAGLLMCLAAVWVWQRRRRGLVAAVLAWLLPTAFTLVADATVGAPSFLMLLALITLASNRHQLH